MKLVMGMRLNEYRLLKSIKYNNTYVFNAMYLI